VHVRPVQAASVLGRKNEDDIAGGTRNKIMFNEKCGFIKLAGQMN
jgi:hypothetical protein